MIAVDQWCCHIEFSMSCQLTLHLHVIVPRLQSFPKVIETESAEISEPIALVPSAGVATFGHPRLWSCNIIVRLIARFGARGFATEARVISNVG